MNPNPENQWQKLFEELPLDTSTQQNHKQKLRQQSLVAYDQSSEVTSSKNRLKSIESYLMTHKTPRYTAIGASLALVAWFFIFTNNGSTFAMDSLIKTIVNAKTVRFVTTAQPKDMPPITIKSYFSEPNRMRGELSGVFVQIMDIDAGKVVTLNANAKTATVFDLVNISDEAKKQHEKNSFAALRNQILEAQQNPQANIESLGEKMLDGRKVIGFRFRTPPAPMTIWADFDSGHPYRIETRSEGPPVTEVTMTDFEFDVELDDSLFSIEIPAGYKQTSMKLDVSLPTEEGFIESLTKYSGAANGKFPDVLSVTTVVEYMKVVGMDKFVGKDGQPNQEMMTQGITFQRGIQFALTLPAESKAHYAGKGVTRGDTDQAIFWYQPDGKDTWRVLDANLNFADASEAPKIEGATPILGP